MAANGAEVEFVVWGPLARQDVPGVCERLSEQLARHDPAAASVVVVDAARLAQSDAVAMEALARIRVTARPRPVRFRNVPAGLRELMEWVGLGHLLRADDPGHADPPEHVEDDTGDIDDAEDTEDADDLAVGSGVLSVEGEGEAEHGEDVPGLTDRGVIAEPALGCLDELLCFRRQEDGDVADPPVGDL